MKLPIVKRMRKKLWGRYTGFSFFIWIWIYMYEGMIYSDPAGRYKRTIRHETIHFKQQVELLFVFQWILYGLFYLYNYAWYWNHRKAYRANPFEIEAYLHDEIVWYLENRPWWHWVEYVRFKPRTVDEWQTL